VQLASESSVQRDAKGRLVKGGGSLNKSGLDRKKLMMLRDLGALTPKAIKTLERLLDDANPSAALGAAKEILDRNLGKVKQQVQVDVTSTHVLHLQALEHLAERKKQQLLEAQSSQLIDITPHATLDRIVSHDDQGAIDASVTAINMSATVEAPRPGDSGGAAAYAPTATATHENPTTEPDKTT
jgi:hypothetical protein